MKFIKYIISFLSVSSNDESEDTKLLEKFAHQIEEVGQPTPFSEEDTILVAKYEDGYYAEIYAYQNYDSLDHSPDKVVRLEDLKNTSFNNMAVKAIADEIPNI